MLEHFIHVQYCYVYLVNQIPMGLLLYAHIPTSLLALLFGTYVLAKTRNVTGFLFFNICIAFFFWCLFDLSAWFSFLGSANTMFTWSFLDFVAVIMFFNGYYFLYAFLSKRDLPGWQKLAAIAISLPTAIVTLLGLNLSFYDSNVCAAIENASYTRFTYVAEAIFIIASIVLVVREYRRRSERLARREVLHAGAAILIFMLFFFSATLSVSLLASSDASLYVYNYLIYGLFGMPIFIAYFGYLIVRYHVFNLKVFGAQAIVFGLVVILAAEFAFANSFASQVLIVITLLITVMGGALLIRSVRREIRQRELIEKQEQDLEVANKQQENLLHFISHEVKGYLTKSEAGFAAITEGDFGTVTPDLKKMADTALTEVRKGVNTIMDILDASNLKKGTVAFNKSDFDFGKAVENVAHDLETAARQRGLALEWKGTDESITINGDQDKIVRHVIRNVIDNSIKYTEHGSVTVAVSKEAGKAQMLVQDTGIGITREDMARLFTEGGRGKDSIKVNVHSTGYGLYIAKQIVDAHGGTIKAESEGTGKGSRFIVQLPLRG